MTDLATAARDLAFLRRRVEGGRQSPPAAIFYLWASIVAIGGVLTDIYPTGAPIFWTLGGLAGGAVSFWLARRWSRTRGASRPRGRIRHALHWGGLLAALLLMGVVEGQGQTDPRAFGGRILLIVGLAYFYAGIHIHRVFFWVAGLEVLGYVVVTLFLGTPWSILGLAIAVGLVGSGVAVTRPKRGAGQMSGANHRLRIET